MRVIIHFNKSSRIKEYNKRQVIAVLTIVSFLFLSLIATTTSVLIHNSTKGLSVENRKLKESIKDLKIKITEIRNSLSKIYETERQLRIATGIDINQDYAVGGEDEINIQSLITDKGNEIKSLNIITNDLINKVKFEQTKFEYLVNKLNEKEELAKRIPAIVPMQGVFSNHSFGMRIHPILKRWKFHEGLDILGLYGTPVYAAGAGVVKFVGWNGGLGLCVIIDHGFGYETTYGHLSKATVREGQKVTRFQKIGECGSSGLSTGPHLHYEVSFNGEKQNPLYYFIK